MKPFLTFLGCAFVLFADFLAFVIYAPKMTLVDIVAVFIVHLGIGFVISELAGTLAKKLEGDGG